MLVRLFRSTQFYPIALIVLFSIVINIVLGFSHPPKIVEEGTLFYQNVTNWIHGCNTWLIVSLIFLFITSQALHLNYVLNKHEVFFKQSWLPALIYLLLSTQFTAFTQFSPLLILNSLFVFVLDLIFALYKNQKTMAVTFDAALLISLIALMYAPAVFFILLLFVGVAILKSISWRDISIGLIGLMVPLLIVLVGYFLSGTLPIIINQYKSGIASNPVFTNYMIGEFFFSAFFIIFVLVLALMKMRHNYLKNVTKSRLCQQILLLFIFLVVIMIPFTNRLGIQNYMLMIIPFSSVIAYYFLDGKKIIYQELLLWLLITNWVYANFFI
ncbi:MAG: hypothetical protein ACKOX3_08585 [Bacteroidota bacterium]